MLDMHHTLGFWRRMSASLRWKVERRYFVLIKDLQRSAPPPALTSRLDLTSLRWTRLTDAEISAVRAMNATLSEAEIRRRWREGQECLLGWMDETLVHYRWDTTRPAYLPYLLKTFRPLEGDTLTTETFTHRAFRGRGIHSVSWALALRRARDSHLARSITIVAWWNAPSLRVNLEKAQKRIAGMVGYWGAGIVRRHFATGLVRFGVDGEVYIRDPEEASEQ